MQRIFNFMFLRRHVNNELFPIRSEIEEIKIADKEVGNKGIVIRFRYSQWKESREILEAQSFFCFMSSHYELLFDCDLIFFIP